MMLWYKIAGFVATESAEKYPDIIFKISGFLATKTCQHVDKNTWLLAGKCPGVSLTVPDFVAKKTAAKCPDGC